VESPRRLRAIVKSSDADLRRRRVSATNPSSLAPRWRGVPAAAVVAKTTRVSGSARKPIPRRSGLAGLAPAGGVAGAGAYLGRFVALTAVLLAALFASAAPSALAAAPFEYQSSITGTGTESFHQPWGLSFDSSGDLFLVDATAPALYKFGPSGSFLGQIGAAEFSEPYLRSVTVADGSGVVYAGNAEPEEVVSFKPEGGGYAHLETKTSAFFNYVAYNNSSGAQAGELYVLHGTPSLVEVFPTDAEGKLGTPTELEAPPEGFELFVEEHQEGEAGLTVDAATGDLYVANPGAETVDVYTGDHFARALTGAATPAGSFVPTGVAVDERSGDLYVLDTANQVIDAFSPAGAYLGQVTGPSAPFAAPPLAIAVQNHAGATRGDLYVSVGSEVDIFSGAGLPKFNLKVDKAGAGQGTVTSLAPNTGISCGATCEDEFEEGAEVELQATPQAGSEFTGWSTVSGAAGTCTGTVSPCTVTLSAAAELRATFQAEASGFLLTITKAGGGGGLVSGGSPTHPGTIVCGSGIGCRHEYPEGEVVTLTAAPSEGSVFGGWEGCVPLAAHPTECEVAVTAAAAVTASFKHEFTLQIASTGSGEGTVAGGSAARPGSLACGSLCQASYLEGEEATLTETAAAGSTFAGWNGCTPVAGHPEQCEVELNGAWTVTASFVAITHTLTVTHAGNGSGAVLCDGGACVSSYPQGAEVTLSAAPAAGSSFAGWSGAGCSGTSTCKVKFAADLALTATFTVNPPAVAPPPVSPHSVQCKVPKLEGLTLAKARSALTKAHCQAGKVTRPKAEKGRKLGPLVVKSSTPGQGKVLAENSKVDLKLGPMPKKTTRRSHR
jgi:hypothetical protein